MGIQVKSSSASAAKFKRNASAAAGDYTEGVKNAGAKWQAGAAGAADNWSAGVQQAVGRGAYARGVSQAGPEKYVRNATTLGPQRFTQGVAAAEQDWEKGTKPYLDLMSNFNFPTPRRPKGDPSNWLRPQELGMALRAKKTGTI